MNDYHQRLVALGFDVKPDAPLATPVEVRRLEEQIGVSLPRDYREFLLSVGKNWGKAFAPYSEPTPRGDEHSILSFHSAHEINGLLDSMITPRNMLTIGVSDGANYTCLSVCGIDRGSVYGLDGEFRAYMDDEEFWQRYPQMADSIQEYLRARDADELPEKPAGYENCYLVAESFDAFLKSLTRDEEA